MQRPVVRGEVVGLTDVEVGGIGWLGGGVITGGAG